MKFCFAIVRIDIITTDYSSSLRQEVFRFVKIMDDHSYKLSIDYGEMVPLI
jgi:RNase P/RNase MRP subunit p30